MKLNIESVPITLKRSPTFFGTKLEPKIKGFKWSKSIVL